MADLPDVGALVISLDFELHWGVRDHAPVDGPYRRNLDGVWRAVPLLLDTFEAFDIAATWATVGMLFARSREEQAAYAPTLRPSYRDARLDPYTEPVGPDEHADPLHFAPSLIAAIARRPGQEIATHTFSHYYCLEPGQTRDQFAADLAAATAIARAHGVPPRSIALPRNQWNADYDGVLIDAGIRAYRGNQPTWMFRPKPQHASTLRDRGRRLLHEYAGPDPVHLTSWSEVCRPSGLMDVPASLFIRGSSPRRRRLDGLRLRRISGALHAAARSGRILHLWWHPHNFGAEPEASIDLLRAVLTEFDAMRSAYGMRALSMGDVVDLLDGSTARS